MGYADEFQLSHSWVRFMQRPCDHIYYSRLHTEHRYWHDKTYLAALHASRACRLRACANALHLSLSNNPHDGATGPAGPRQMSTDCMRSSIAFLHGVSALLATFTAVISLLFSCFFLVIAFCALSIRLNDIWHNLALQILVLQVAHSHIAA